MSRTGDGVGGDCLDCPLGLLPLFLRLKCVSDDFNLNRSSSENRRLG